jgi:cytochrome P450
VQVAAEALSAFGADEARPERRGVDNMTYTLSVLKEALRKYSVVPVVTRMLAKDDELLGHKIPRNTMIACILKVSKMVACLLDVRPSQ